MRRCWIGCARQGSITYRSVCSTPIRNRTTTLPEPDRSTVSAPPRAAEARYRNREVELESQILAQQSQLATVESELTQAMLQAEADALLAPDGLVSSIQLRQSQSRARELTTRHELEQERLQIARESVDIQLAAEQADVDRLKTLWALRLDQVDDLHVRAGITGVLQQVPLEEGQRVTAGANLARVGDPSRLKAELRISETQAKARGGLRPARAERGRCRECLPPNRAGPDDVDLGDPSLDRRR